MLYQSDIVSAIGAFSVGVLSNVYARFAKSSSFIVAILGILFLVPSGVAAAGGLVISSRGNDTGAYAHSLGVGLLMVQIALGVCAHSASSLVAGPFR